MIKKLTQLQIDEMERYKEKWISIGLCTDPIDKIEAGIAVLEMYATVNLKPPKIVWCGSPLSQGLTRAVVLNMPKVRDSVGDSVLDSVGDSVRDSVWASVRDSVGDSVWASVWASVLASVWASVWDSVGDSVLDSVGASVRDSVGDSVRDSVRDSVWASVRDSVGDSVLDSVGASVGASVWASVRDSAYGQHDASWIGFYDFFRNVCGLVKETDKLIGLTRLTKASGWALPHEKICWVSERHNLLKRDDLGRLHCDSGPALGYPDGFSIHAWHGVRVQGYVIESPEKITIEDASGEQNAEVRRVKINRMGVDRFVRESNAECVDVDDHKIFDLSTGETRNGNGLRALFRSKFGAWLHCACPSTARTYWMDVPPECKTCEEADVYLRNGIKGNLIGAT